MNSFKYYLLSLSLLSVMLTSCGEKDEMTNGPTVGEQTFDNGVFILNEGPFMGGSASIDYFDRSGDSIIRNVYSVVNDGQVIGSILQSMNVINDKAYFVVNNSQKIEVTNASTLNYEETISGVFQPRYLIEFGGNIIVSEWGVDGFTGKLKKIDISTNMITDSLLANGPEQMLLQNSILYVANSGGFGLDSIVTVYDAITLQGAEEIEVGKKPTDLVADKDGDVWVLCSGSTWPTAIEGSLQRITNKTVSLAIEIAAGSSSLVINGEGNRLYFIQSGKVWTMSIHDTAPSLFYDYTGTKFLYSLGYDTNDDLLYVGEADFSGESTVSVLSTDGTITKDLNVGVGVGSFFIR